MQLPLRLRLDWRILQLRHRPSAVGRSSRGSRHRMLKDAPGGGTRRRRPIRRLHRRVIRRTHGPGLRNRRRSRRLLCPGQSRHGPHILAMSIGVQAIRCRSAAQRTHSPGMWTCRRPHRRPQSRPGTGTGRFRKHSPWSYDKVVPAGPSPPFCRSVAHCTLLLPPTASNPIFAPTFFRPSDPPRIRRVVASSDLDPNTPRGYREP